MRRSCSLAICFLAILSLSTICLAVPLPRVVITHLDVNNDSVRVYYKPFRGAADYRIYALANPKEVKYSGVVHFFASNAQHWVTEKDGTLSYPYRTEADTAQCDAPKRVDVPKLDIECNGLPPDRAVQLVIEAVDRPGPAPYSNLATEQNAPRSGKRDQPVGSAKKSGSAMVMLGSNAGSTDDGLYSINGTGGPHAVPKVIARSEPVVAVPTGKRALPSAADASQVVFDTFGSGTIQTISGTRNIALGNQTYLMHSDIDWRIDFIADDILHSIPFIMNRHYMDVLFDGGTPGSNNPLHITHGSMVMSPLKTADYSGGKILHITMEVDAHVDSRRWLGFIVVPENDPVRNVYFFNAPINKSHVGLDCQFFGENITIDQFTGYGNDGKTSTVPLVGALGQAPVFAGRPLEYGYNGRGLDNRSRLDLFLSKKRIAVFEDGHPLVDYDFKGDGLAESVLKSRVYFVHYLYHTANEINEIKSYYSWETAWLNLFPYSDERHWDNMGFEVLPSKYSNFAIGNLAKLITDDRSKMHVDIISESN